MSRFIQKTMGTSFDLYVLQDNCYKLLTINVFKVDNQSYVELNTVETEKTRFLLKLLKGIHLCSHVCKRVKVPDIDGLKLWKLENVKMRNIKEKSISTEEDIVEKLNGEEMELDEPFSRYFKAELDELDGNENYVPVSSIITIIPASIDTPKKRIKLEDRTNDFLRELLPPFEEKISLDNVEQLLSKPLLYKLPCIPVFIADYSDFLKDLNSYDTYPARLCTIVDDVLSKSFKQSPGGETVTLENINYHIKHIIDLVQDFDDSFSGFDLDRNRGFKSSSSVTYSRDRPDMTVYFNKVLIMMGEEKDMDYRLGDAEKQLDGYFNYWNTLAFGRLPFIMAYVAAGTRLQFYYYHPDPGNQNKPARVKIGDFIDIGTTNRRNNYKVLQCIINFIRIIKTWRKDGYLVEPKIKLYQVIARENGTTITITPQKVMKKLHVENQGPYKNFLKDFYNRVFPNLEKYKLLSSKFFVKWIHLEFAPVGYMTIPENENELRDAICDVLKLVKILHENLIVHRDIRWENVIRITNDGWILIDYEEVAPIGGGNQRTPILNITAPENRGDNGDLFQAAGDIWMIGNLINDSRIGIQLSERARNFRDKLIQPNPDKRPNAANAINDDWFKDM